MRRGSKRKKMNGRIALWREGEADFRLITGGIPLGVGEGQRFWVTASFNGQLFSLSGSTPIHRGEEGTTKFNLDLSNTRIYPGGRASSKIDGNRFNGFISREATLRQISWIFFLRKPLKRFQSILEDRLTTPMNRGAFTSKSKTTWIPPREEGIPNSWSALPR